jgi:hypothetical protein
MTSCHCAKLPDVYYVDDWPEAAGDRRTQIDEREWESLVSCNACGMLWAVDVWDKYQDQVAAKVLDKETWSVASETRRKNLLLKSRGGVGDGTCLWANCDKPRVKNVVYCIDHLWGTGARK